jgi:hypothetical protein
MGEAVNLYRTLLTKPLVEHPLLRKRKKRIIFKFEDGRIILKFVFMYLRTRIRVSRLEW